MGFLQISSNGDTSRQKEKRGPLAALRLCQLCTDIAETGNRPFYLSRYDISFSVFDNDPRGAAVEMRMYRNSYLVTLT